MSSIEEQEQVESKVSGGLTFRQKFWLFGVGLPVLLMIVLLALAVFLPGPLNPTEQRLLGRWEIVFPAPSTRVILEFTPDYNYSTVSKQSAMWTADEKTI